MCRKNHQFLLHRAVEITDLYSSVVYNTTYVEPQYVTKAQYVTICYVLGQIFFGSEQKVS